MNLSDVIKSVCKTVNASLLNDTQRQAFIHRLEVIERRWSDANLYVGIVGEFSSGKSTLINSLIGEDYFVTNSLQGTTTVITSIRYGNSINLELRYKDGRVLKYSNNKLALIEKFLPEEYSRLTFADKLKIKAGDFFSLNSKDEFMLKIFEIVSTSNKISRELDEVVVYYPSDFLRKGIVLVDTPGTDSLIDMHTEITCNAIANKCDLAFVIVPALTPVSITLSDFISEYLEHCISNCHFLVTKIELIKQSDRQDHLAGVKKRLVKMNELHDPHVMAAPTLLSLENRGIIEPSGVLKDLSPNEKSSLVSKYDEDISNLFKHLYENKGVAKTSVVLKLLEDLINDVISELNELLVEKKDLLDKKRSGRTIPLQDLIGKLDRKDLSSIHEIALNRIESKLSSQRSSFESVVYSDISGASTKDGIQATMSTEKSINKGKQSFQECYNHAIEQTNWMISYYEEAIRKLGNSFREAYSLDPLEFKHGSDSSGITIKNYKNSFSTFPLSTFFLKRMFISKEKIRSEMRETVRAYMIAIYDDLYRHYSLKIVKLDEKLCKSVDKLMQQYTKKFSKVVKSRIEQEAEVEKSISDEIDYIGRQISELQGTIGKYYNKAV